MRVNHVTWHVLNTGIEEPACICDPAYFCDGAAVSTRFSDPWLVFEAWLLFDDLQYSLTMHILYAFLMLS